MNKQQDLAQTLMDARRRTHADECKRVHNFSAAFYVQAVICLALESLPTNPYPMLVAFQDPEIQLALDQLFPKPRPLTYSAQN